MKFKNWLYCVAILVLGFQAIQIETPQTALAGGGDESDAALYCATHCWNVSRPPLECKKACGPVPLSLDVSPGLTYLDPAALDPDSAIPPPPLLGSPESDADILQILAYQATRTVDDCHRADYEASVSTDTFFGPAFGPLSQAEVETLSPLMDQVRADTDYFVQEIKKRWDRPRPYLTNASIHPCIQKEVTHAYPSGHAAISRVFARVLTVLWPKRKPEFDARADRIAQDRVLAGVHHPSDIEAGKRLGDLIFEKLGQSQQFNAEVARLRP